jgi:hypothetical protein
MERFGDFNSAPFAAESPHQICVCRPVSAGPAANATSLARGRQPTLALSSADR